MTNEQKAEAKRVYNRERYQRKREEIIEQTKLYNKKNAKKIKSWRHRYRLDNIEKIREHDREYRHKTGKVKRDSKKECNKTNSTP